MTVIGVAGSIPNVGDAKPYNLLGIPLMIIRDKYMKIPVFHNVCSHRGFKLMEKPGTLRNIIRCPYHSWSYDFKEYIKLPEQRWSKFINNYDHELLKKSDDYDCFTLDVKCNWEFAIENYCESYHLPWIHPELNKISNIKEHFKMYYVGNDSANGEELKDMRKEVQDFGKML